MGAGQPGQSARGRPVTAMEVEVLQRGEVHDVVVIGSGASGAMAAHTLVEHGVRVLMLDAGWKFDRSLSWAHVLPFEADRRLQQGDRPQPFRLDAREQPYLTPEGRPFDLYRTWGWGGKTNVWGRVSLRMADLDFAGPERDGWDIPWPIRYADIAPYYDRVEQLIGVTGGDDDSDSLPGSRYHLPPVRPRCTEVILTRAAESLGIPSVPIRRAVLTLPHNGRSACHYCGSCGSGCRTASYFNATDYLLLPAIETGRLEIVSGAVAARVTTDSEGRASGVQYFERESGAERHVRARTVVVAASAMDSTRILLNSQSTRHPNGLGNGNDQLGRNYCEQVRFHRHGFLPQLFGSGYTNDDGIGGGHTYIPALQPPPQRARLPARLRHPDVDERLPDDRRQRRRAHAGAGVRGRLQAAGRGALPRPRFAPSLRRDAAAPGQPGDRRSGSHRPLRRAADAHRRPVQ